jgi:protein O-mannosyl-transferase
MNNEHLSKKQTSGLYIFAAVVSLTTISVYLPALKNGFVNWDDDQYIYNNPHILLFNFNLLRWSFTEFYASNWHPLTWLSHALDYKLWGFNPYGHHLTSVIFHSLNTFLVVILTGRLLKNAGTASIIKNQKTFLNNKGILAASSVTGLLFGVHPLHVESVAWISERKDLLYSFFYLLSILSYMRYTEKKGATNRQAASVYIFSDKFYITALGLFILSIMSKPMAITIPFVFLIIDWFQTERMTKDGLGYILLEKLPFFVFCLISGVITVSAQKAGSAVETLRAIPLDKRTIVAFKSLATYIQKMLVPEGLIPFYRHPQKVSALVPEYLVPILLVTGISLACVITAKKHKLLPSLWAYYVITLLPVIGLVQVGNQAMADRYTYLPSLGPFLLAGIGAAFLMEKSDSLSNKYKFIKFVPLVPVIFTTGILSLITIKQIHVWENSLTLWSHEIKFDPISPRAYYFLADANAKAGMTDEALEKYTEAIRLSLALYDEIASRSYSGRAVIYEKKGLDKNAIDDYTHAIRLSGRRNDRYFYFRGNLYMKNNQYENALQDFTQAINSMPVQEPAYYNNRGAVYANLKRFDEAVSDFNSAVLLSPSSPLLYRNRGNAYKDIGRIEEANKDFATADSLDIKSHDIEKGGPGKP